MMKLKKKSSLFYNLGKWIKNLFEFHHFFSGGAREQSAEIRSIPRKTPLLPRSSYLTKEIPPFRNSALNVEKGAGKSRRSAERNSAESDSGERDESLSEVQTLKRSKSKRELAEEVVFLRNNLRKSQVLLNWSISKIIIDKRFLKWFWNGSSQTFFPKTVVRGWMNVRHESVGNSYVGDNVMLMT